MRVRGLDLWRGAQQVLTQVDLDIPDRAATALIGPSGCGKTAFLRVLNRMSELLPDARLRGEVLLDGEDIYAPGVDPVAVRRKVGLIFATPNPFALSIFENTAYGLRVAGVRARDELAASVEEALRAAALWDDVKDRLGRSALELDPGRLQRLCIARAVAVKPSVLLMDEPAAALDPISTGKIEEVIEEIKRRVAVVIVTHNLQQAARISDRVALFLDGRLVEADDASRIFTRPRDKRTEEYITGRFG